MQHDIFLDTGAQAKATTATRDRHQLGSPGLWAHRLSAVGSLFAFVGYSVLKLERVTAERESLIPKKGIAKRIPMSTSDTSKIKSNTISLVDEGTSEDSTKKSSNQNQSSASQNAGSQQQQVPQQMSNYFNDFPPGKFGTYMSFILMIIGFIASIVILSYADSINLDSLSTDCPQGYEKSCKQIGCVMRFSFALFIIFVFQLFGTALYPRFFDLIWAIKFITFAGLVVGFFYATNNVFNSDGFAWLARICGFAFLIFQQVVLIDFAYHWNEKWVEYARNDEEGWGQAYLIGLIAASVFLYCVSYSAVGIMYWQFGSAGCSENLAVISLTLVLTIVVTILQVVVNSEYSLLASAIVTFYATYVCYATVTISGYPQCNPTLAGPGQTLQAAIGMALTALALTWTTITSVGSISRLNIDGKVAADADSAVSNEYSSELRSLLLEVTGILILISCYYAMVLTNWATLQTDSGLGNPKIGTASFWLQASAQWCCLLLYAWTLVASSLFPDRDFGGNGGNS